MLNNRNNTDHLVQIIKVRPSLLLMIILLTISTFLNFVFYLNSRNTAVKIKETPNSLNPSKVEAEPKVAQTSENLIINEESLKLSNKYLGDERLALGLNKYYLDLKNEEVERNNMSEVTTKVFMKNQTGETLMEIATDVTINALEPGVGVEFVYPAAYTSDYSGGNKLYIVVSKNGESQLWIVDVDKKQIITKIQMPKKLLGSAYFFADVKISPDNNMLLLSVGMNDAGGTNLFYVYKIAENEFVEIPNRTNEVNSTFYYGWHGDGLILIEGDGTDWSNTSKVLHTVKLYNPISKYEKDLFKVNIKFGSFGGPEPPIYDGESLYFRDVVNGEKKALYKYSFEDSSLYKVLDLSDKIDWYRFAGGNVEGKNLVIIQLVFKDEQYTKDNYSEYYQKYFVKDQPAFFAINEKQYNTLTPVEFVD